MRARRLPVAVLLALLVLSSPAVSAAPPPTPAEFLKKAIGADRTLADWGEIVSYFRALDAASDRVEVSAIGKSTLGEEMILAAISAPENLAKKDRIREIARRLADPRGLSDSDAKTLVSEGKVVLLVTCAIHASEIASTQMAMEWAHALATAEDAETKRRLSEVVLLLVPSINPDGNRMEVDWYRKNLGTRWEGSRMPWLYHHYTGHDNNRDFTQLTQAETKVVNRVLYHDWFPQVFLDEHQMGTNGPRMFVPPYADPLDPDIHPLVIREVNSIGSLMSMRLEQAGKAGVISAWTFDASWPGGSKNTAWWKNVTGVLTEVASVKLATPVEVPASELRGGGKGLVSYGAQVNFPNPWRGGTWRLRDIMDYERIASDALLEYCATHRSDVLGNMLAKARSAIARSAPGEAYRIPTVQRDPASARALAALLVEHGVEVLRDAAGDAWVPLAQPYGRFVREMMELQRFPEVKLVPGRDIVAPYDVTAWSLPLSMGVTAARGTLPEGLKPWAPPAAAPLAAATAYALGPESPERWKVVAAARKGGEVSYLPAADGPLAAGTIVLDAGAAKAAAPVAGEVGLALVPLPKAPAGAAKLRAPRVGLYKPWAASMDEGWTRFLLERYGFAPVTLDIAAVRAGKLGTRFDVVLLPDVDKDVLATGKPKREEGEMRYFPEPRPEYAGGLGKEGAAALKEFVEGGGTLVALASASEYLLEELQLPVRNVLGRAKADEFLCPGSLVRLEVDPSHPVTWGLPPTVPAFLDGPLAFQTAIPGAEMTRRVLAAYPADGRDVLVSGWIRGEERLARNAAAVAATLGKGRVVLLGFRAQHRAQTVVTFPFLFNALAWSVL
jgi:hypothetical protein